MNHPKPIRLLIVDDSALVRKVVTESLRPFPDIEVVGTAVDPYVARDRILDLDPDVITLDIEMPRMDGISFLKLIMQHRPMPVIIMSSLTQAGSAKAMEALQAGAVDVIGKPGSTYSAHEDGTRLAERIRAAAMARVARPRCHVPTAQKDREHTGTPSRVVRSPTLHTTGFHPRQLILLGASTGGTEALLQVLSHMSGDVPGICIVQHIPAHFSNAFAQRLNSHCAMEVREARHGDAVTPGLALVAPGGFHLLLRWNGMQHVVELSQGPEVHHQRPAVDMLFESVLRAHSASSCVAAVLTGMGSDGAAGLLKLRSAGARTVAQDEATSVVFGMPKEAIRLGAAESVLPLDHIGPHLELLSRKMTQCPQPSPPIR